MTLNLLSFLLINNFFRTIFMDLHFVICGIYFQHPILIMAILCMVSHEGHNCIFTRYLVEITRYHKMFL